MRGVKHSKPIPARVFDIKGTFKKVKTNIRYEFDWFYSYKKKKKKKKKKTESSAALIKVFALIKFRKCLVLGWVVLKHKPIASITQKVHFRSLAYRPCHQVYSKCSWSWFLVLPFWQGKCIKKVWYLLMSWPLLS